MINVLPIPTLRKARDITDFTTATAQKLVSDRKQAIREGTLDLDEDSRDIMALLSKCGILTGFPFLMPLV
jgi:hypothetical protein